MTTTSLRRGQQRSIRVGCASWLRLHRGSRDWLGIRVGVWLARCVRPVPFLAASRSRMCPGIPSLRPSSSLLRGCAAGRPRRVPRHPRTRTWLGARMHAQAQTGSISTARKRRLAVAARDRGTDGSQPRCTCPSGRRRPRPCPHATNRASDEVNARGSERSRVGGMKRRRGVATGSAGTASSGTALQTRCTSPPLVTWDDPARRGRRRKPRALRRCVTRGRDGGRHGPVDNAVRSTRSMERSRPQG